MSWQKISIANPDLDIMKEFHLIFFANKAPRNAAVFSHHEMGSKTYEYYFSPGAAAIAPGMMEKYKATISEPPSPKAALLVGHVSARKHLGLADQEIDL